MRIILGATPLSGHLNPLLAAGRVLAAAGHEVCVVTGSALRKQVETAGLDFVPLFPGADLDLGDLDQAFPERKYHPAGPAQLKFDFEHVFVDTIPGQFLTLQTLLADFPADVILVDTLFGGALPFLLGACGARPLVAVLGVTILTSRRDDGAPMGLALPPATSDAQRSQYAQIAAEVDAAFMTPVRERADRLLAELGASPLPMSYSDAMVDLPDLYLQTGVAGFEYPRCRQRAGLHFIGALPGAPGAGLPPAIAQALAAGKRLVLVTQGTVANADLGQLVGPSLLALAPRDDVLVVVTTGGRPVGDIPVALPANTVAAPYWNLTDLMPHVDVMVTNGGYGTVLQALSNGVAIVAAGTSEDKPEVNARIAWSGAGIDLRTDRPDPARLRAALDTILDGEEHIRHAAALQAEFAHHAPSHDLLRHLERACSRFGADAARLCR